MIHILYQSVQNTYPGASSVVMMPSVSVNHALQYVQKGTPLASNAHNRGQIPHVVNSDPQIIPPGFSYPPQMLFSS